MGQILPVPIRSKLLRRVGDADMRIGSAEMQGYRVNMEDAMTIDLLMHGETGPPRAFLGVYDGHGGQDCSAYLKTKVVSAMASQAAPLEEKTIIDVMRDVDAQFLSDPEVHSEHGSTAVFTMVDKIEKHGRTVFKLTVANIGDSRAVLVKGATGECISLTTDHKPEDEEENQRIKAAGGFARNNRVDGELAMSRAMGDHKYKTNTSLKYDQQKVIALPDVRYFEAEVGDILLVCCDGIVEQMTNEDAAAFIYEEAKKSTADPAEICTGLLELSLTRGSKDNMSAMICIFEDGTDYNHKDVFRPGPYTAHKARRNFSQAYLDDAKSHGYEGQALTDLIAAEEAKMDPAELVPAEGAAGGDSSPMGNPLLQSLMAALGGSGTNEADTQAMLSLLASGAVQVREVGDEEGEDGSTPTEQDS